MLYELSSLTNKIPNITYILTYKISNIYISNIRYLNKYLIYSAKLESNIVYKILNLYYILYTI